MKKRLHLFEGYGVELEYMIVEKSSLNVSPVADVILRDEQHEVVGTLEQGMTAWSNELVSHVIEVKGNGPKSDLVALRDKMVADIRQINEQLSAIGCQLLSSAAHPWMNPEKETKLWEYENQEIYHLYDRIFNCKGHGWSNLQSTHINLPFYDDEEFSRLHTAIRFLMPMIPALTASSPILDEKFTGYIDKRLYYYEKNQAKIPIITGKVVPERLFSKHQYQKHVYDHIAKSLAPLDPNQILEPVWVNSRGAMARFDRGAIEIRIIDIQECVSADLAVVALITEAVKMLVQGKLIPFNTQETFETQELYDIFKACVKYGSKAEITDEAYLEAWGYKESITGNQFWNNLIDLVEEKSPEFKSNWSATITEIVKDGTLAERILKAVNKDFSRENLKDVYSRIGNCLQNDQIFTV